MAMLPTPPAAPVTTTGPPPGRTPPASSPRTQSIAVRPAVPMPIACWLVSVSGRLTSQSAFTRWRWL